MEGKRPFRFLRLFFSGESFSKHLHLSNRPVGPEVKCEKPFKPVHVIRQDPEGVVMPVLYPETDKVIETNLHAVLP